MRKVRSTQILPLRKTLKGEVEFVCVKDRVAKKALETLDVPGMKEISGELKGQLMFLIYKHVTIQTKRTIGQK